MDRSKIHHHYSSLCNLIEEEYADRYLEPELKHFYLICHLFVLASFERYIELYGKYEIDIELASVGKSDYLGLGNLSQLEKDASLKLNNCIVKQSTKNLHIGVR